MRGILFRWIVLTVAIIFADYVIDGIYVNGFLPAFLAAAILGILNAFLRPVLIILTLPFNIITFGLFTFIINALLLKMAAGVIPGFEIDGFGPAILGSFLISLVSWLMNTLISDRGQVEYIDMKKGDGGRWE